MQWFKFSLFPFFHEFTKPDLNFNNYKNINKQFVSCRKQEIHPAHCDIVFIFLDLENLQSLALGHSAVDATLQTIIYFIVVGHE